MNPGDVVLASLPQADGTYKDRPAVYLKEMPQFRDMLVCGISTQLRHEVNGFDDVLLDTEPDFLRTGLSRSSLIRLGFLAVIPRNVVLGSIGSLTPERHRRLLERLSGYLIS